MHHSSARRWLAASLLSFTAIVGAACAPTPSGTRSVPTTIVPVPRDGLVINEFSDRVNSAPPAAFVEIENTATTARSTSGLVLLLISATTGHYYDVEDLSPAGSLAPGQFLVIGGSQLLQSVPAGALKLPGWSLAPMQAGAGGLALVDNSTSPPRVLDSMSYGGPLTAVSITTVGTSVNLVDGNQYPTGTCDGVPASIFCSMERIPDGQDTHVAAADWRPTLSPTPGATNH